MEIGWEKSGGRVMFGWRMMEVEGLVADLEEKEDEKDAIGEEKYFFLFTEV